MTLDYQRPYDWREKTIHLAWKLDRAHCAVEDLSAALEGGIEDSVRHAARSAHEAVGEVGQSMRTLCLEQPPIESLDELDAVGSTLAIEGSVVATIALDMMIDAMVALAFTDDEAHTDFLLGACIDAESAYEVSTAIVQAAPLRDESAVLDLQRAFKTDGEVALRNRVIMSRPRVREINERVNGVLATG